MNRTNDSDTRKPVRVLIIDDEACISDLLAEMLRLLGYAPTQSFSPSVALRELEAGDFDVILSDFRMPQMNGDELYRKAIARRPELRERFVFLTGDTMSEDTQIFLSEQARPHLNKPFELETMIQVISQVLAEQNRAIAA
jgi:CheY-like chemotaxis protein